MEDLMLLRDAAAHFNTTTRTARRILALDTEDGRRNAHAGYDAAGRTLLRGDVVRKLAEKRDNRGNWRVANLKHFARTRSEKAATIK